MSAAKLARVAKAGAKTRAKAPATKSGARGGAAVKKLTAPAKAAKVATKAAKVATKTATKAARTRRAAAKRPAPQTAPVRRPGEREQPMVLTGRGGARVWGTKHPAAQLSERQVVRFRRLVREGKATVGDLAAETGCGHARISMAVRGQTWAHLNDVAPPVPGGSRGR